MGNIIEVKNLGKKYIIAERQGYLALRDILTNIFKSPAKWFGGKIKTALGDSNSDEFWALKDVNFEVKQGEVLGIIGRNGAGKSTLLKILSQITPPTVGEIRLKGRVGSLLEVGTGFHPELTGRENIYLNGAILGMRKKEIKEKFDEIVEFSGIDKFLDMPVKRYSSGMYIRLAFAVAAHLDPEILVVDEVLAVGDAEFQKKCLGKMEEVTQTKGRTVLFVSHNMEAIQKLCNRCVYLDKGKVEMIGDTRTVINTYLKNSVILSDTILKDRKDRQGNGKIRMTDVYMFDPQTNKRTNVLHSGQDVYLICEYEVKDKNIDHFYFGSTISTLPEQHNVVYIGNKLTNEKIDSSRGVFKIKINKLPLNTGNYEFSAICTDELIDVYDWVTDAGKFEVEPGYFYQTGKTPPRHEGPLLLDFLFE